MASSLPRLILHVGHAKTGSSALQTRLARGAGALAALGVIYPGHRLTDDAAAGRISSGNVARDGVTAAYEAAIAAHPGARAILLSNETLMSAHLDDAAPFAALVARGVEVRMVLFIRNPLGHALSLYGQEIKRDGADEELTTRLARYDMPARVLRFLTAQRTAGATVCVANYSACRADVGAAFCRLAGLPENILPLAPDAPVNRSLTRAETEVQRAFNRHWGAGSARFVSDPLCNRLPDIPSERPSLSHADYDAFAERMAPLIAATNAHLPSDAAYRLEPYAPATGDGAAPLSPGQIDVLARAISARIPREDVTDAFITCVERLRMGLGPSDSDIATLTAMARALRPGSRRLDGPVAPRGAPARSWPWQRR